MKDLIFAIGDVHGQAFALEAALKKIGKIPANGRKKILVFTGDIVDRGIHQLRSIDLVMKAHELADCDEVHFLPGNHELMMLEAIDRPDWGLNFWVGVGGESVLMDLDPMKEKWTGEEVRDVLNQRIPAFLELARNAPSHLWIENMLFVHAGVSPNEPLQSFLSQGPFEFDRRRNHWAWIREEFLLHKGGWDPDGKVVVIHGHTKANRKKRLSNGIPDGDFDMVESHRRICLDAGASDFPQVALLTLDADDYRIEIIYA